MSNLIRCYNPTCNAEFIQASWNNVYCCQNCKAKGERVRRKMRTGGRREQEKIGRSDVSWFKHLHNPTKDELERVCEVYRLVPDTIPSKVTGDVPKDFVAPEHVVFERNEKENFWFLN